MSQRRSPGPYRSPRRFATMPSKPLGFSLIATILPFVTEERRAVPEKSVPSAQLSVAVNADVDEWTTIRSVDASRLDRKVPP